MEKGADTPSAAGTHLDALRDGDAGAARRAPTRGRFPGEPREMIPYVLVKEPAANASGWYLGIEFSGRTRISLERSGAALRGEAGLNPFPVPTARALPPGATFVTPTVFVGASRADADGAGNVVRRWVRAVLGNPRTLRRSHLSVARQQQLGQRHGGR